MTQYFQYKWRFMSVASCEGVSQIALVTDFVRAEDKVSDLAARCTPAAVTEGITIEKIKETLRPETVITGGYGEYILTRAPGSTYQEIDQKTYEVCYRALIQLKEQSLCNEKRLSEREVIAQIDPTLRLTFVPRALYEMYYMEQCVKECLAKDRQWISNVYQIADEGKIPAEATNSWHELYFGHHGDDYHPNVIKMAYRLNEVISSELKPDGAGNLTYGEITAIARKKLEFLHQMNKDSQSGISVKVKELAMSSPLLGSLYVTQPYGILYPLGIDNEANRELALNIIALECSSIARDARILYRGGYLAEDSLVFEHRAKLLSFGSGAWAGALRDPGACAFAHMLHTPKDAYAIVIPNEEVRTSIFSIPTTHPLCQCNGAGESFHGRAKAWTSGVDPTSATWGLGGALHAHSTLIYKLPSHMRIDLTEDQFIEKYRHHLRKGLVVLRRAVPVS